jgi:hypothetical protein
MTSYILQSPAKHANAATLVQKRLGIRFGAERLEPDQGLRDKISGAQFSGASVPSATSGGKVAKSYKKRKQWRSALFWAFIWPSRWGKVLSELKRSMSQRVDIHALLSQTTDKDQKVASFALLSLGVIESLVGGAITASRAVQMYFNADNCLYVREQLREKVADEIMSRGVQLPDIFDALSAEQAQQEFQRELSTIRLLCLTLLEEKQLAA